MPINPKIHLILLLTLLLAGCAPAAAAETPTPLPSRTASQTAATTRTASPTATLTPVPPTVTNTPTPTLSPTITMAPLPFNACPATDEAYQYPFPESVTSELELIDLILEALNNGITLPHLQNSLSQVKNNYQMYAIDKDDLGNPIEAYLSYINSISIRDLTGDGVNEVIFTAGLSGLARLQVYSCQQGRYIKLFFHEHHRGTDLAFIDLNGNNIPEIINLDYGYAMVGPNLTYIYEWDGESFRSLISPNSVYQDTRFPDALVSWAYCSDYQWKADGIYDILMRGNYWMFGTHDAKVGPIRGYSFKLIWNGTHFQETEPKPDPPKYRFQAVQDGDWETWRGNYEKAFAFYDQAMNDPALESWGDKECEEERIRTYQSQEYGQPAPPPCPPAPNEQAVLDAYLHYRYMLIYTAQGKETLARNEYLALTQLSTSHPAYPLKGLATAFLDEYQDTQDLVAACVIVREYCYDNLGDFYNTIGNSWYLWRAPAPELVCPFEEEPEPTGTITANLSLKVGYAQP